ncbi:hypothetical protein ABZ883_32500 [Streptomyces sp. NPDC046977]|uniref:hypothetical protein n=1 Tax=Streptomyces sp. NPDC046977 TaxID=3154703 RepID=UPI0033D51A1C
MTDPYQDALAALSWNPSAPDSVLLRLLRHGDEKVRRNVAQRRDLPQPVVDAILTAPIRPCAWNSP